MQVGSATYNNVQTPINESSSGKYSASDMSFKQALMNAGSVHGNGLSESPTQKLDTNLGHQKINLDTYLLNTPLDENGNRTATGRVDLMSIPLLMPTAHNVDALAKYSEGKFNDLMQQYNIPSAPSSLSFDGEGKPIITEGYPYKAQLEQALEDQSLVANALRTTGALASHLAGMMESAAFSDEMLAANSQAEKNLIVNKYAHLFGEDRARTNISIYFLENGSMLVGAKSA